MRRRRRSAPPRRQKAPASEGEGLGFKIGRPDDVGERPQGLPVDAVVRAFHRKSQGAVSVSRAGVFDGGRQNAVAGAEIQHHPAALALPDGGGPLGGRIAVERPPPFQSSI